jgi:hypothetical protein
MNNCEAMESDQGIQGLLDHVEILRENICSLELDYFPTISTKEGAHIALKRIREAQEKINTYQQTARALKTLLARVSN